MAPGTESLHPRGAYEVSVAETTNINGKRSFTLSSCARVNTKPHSAKKLSVLQNGVSTPSALEQPSEMVVRQLGTSQVIMGVDIETNDFNPNPAKRAMAIGGFGFRCFCNPTDLNFRIVQLGWAVGDAVDFEPTKVKEHLVRPDGYCISARATEHHGISQELAEKQGLPITDVLDDFMRDAVRVDKMGGRVVIHHLEFDAGIIDAELQRYGLQQWCEQWRKIARKGFCTMDPDVMHWAQLCVGRDMDAGEKSLVMNLRKAMALFVRKTPATHNLLSRKNTAGADAQMHRLLYIAYRRMLEEVRPRDGKRSHGVCADWPA